MMTPQATVILHRQYNLKQIGVHKIKLQSNKLEMSNRLRSATMPIAIMVYLISTVQQDASVLSEP